MIKTVTKKELREVNVQKHYLDDAVAKEIAVGLLSGDLALKEWERQREYFDTYFYPNIDPVIRQETVTAVLHIKGYKITIEK